METFELAVEIKKVTPKAVLCSDGDFEGWLPRSQIETSDDIEEGKTISIEIPEWLAKAKGFI